MIENPCVRNCCLDGDDVCMGCFRTLDEILVWAASNDTQRQKILKLADQRRLKVSTKGNK